MRKKVIKSEYPAHPIIAVGAVIFKDDRVLLVKRGKPPSKDRWAIPGGKLNLGESLQEAAQREIFEETNIMIKAKNPIFAFDVIERDEKRDIQFHYVIVDLDADYISGEVKAGDDAVKAAWVSRKELQTLDINPATRNLLKNYFGFDSE